jgi:hypothetical protein
MADDGRVPRRRTRTLKLARIPLGAIVATGLLTSQTGAGRALAAPRPEATASYPALLGDAPLGLIVSDAAAARQEGSAQPVWRTAADSSRNTPRPQTIRRLPASDPHLESWIAESSTGGICVLLSPARAVNGVRAVGATCTNGPATLQAGTFLTYQYPEGREIALAGVAPSGVTSVLVTFADGTQQSSPVTGDGWSLQTAVTPISVTAEPTGSAVQIGGE